MASNTFDINLVVFENYCKKIHVKLLWTCNIVIINGLSDSVPSAAKDQPSDNQVLQLTLLSPSQCVMFKPVIGEGTGAICSIMGAIIYLPVYLIDFTW